jgi:hypothetical protein
MNDNINMDSTCSFSLVFFPAISWESFGSLSSSTTVLTPQACERDRNHYNGLDFKIIIDSKSGPPTTLTLVASTHQEKIAWCSDISQVCMHGFQTYDQLSEVFRNF